MFEIKSQNTTTQSQRDIDKDSNTPLSSPLLLSYLLLSSTPLHSTTIQSLLTSRNHLILAFILAIIVAFMLVVMLVIMLVVAVRLLHHIRHLVPLGRCARVREEVPCRLGRLVMPLRGMW